jgi:hypothetical protein
MIRLAPSPAAARAYEYYFIVLGSLRQFGPFPDLATCAGVRGQLYPGSTTSRWRGR